MKIVVAGATGVVGRRVVDVVGERGHDAVPLSRAGGVDLVTGAGLAGRLDGADAVIDVVGVSTQSAAASRRFFEATSRILLDAASAADIRHYVLLGIVGSTLAPFGYYTGKAAQEKMVEAGPVPWSILRATQFHEFAGQMLGQVRLGPFTVIPKMTSQPVAAREVAGRLVDLALGEPSGHAPDLSGPEVLQMIDMVSRYAEATGDRSRLLEIPVPGGFGRALRNGTLLPVGPHDTGSQTYAEWLERVRVR